MKPVHEKIWELAKPYLNTRKNNIHTEISIQMAYNLMEREGGDEDIVIPAVILHDVGWSKVPENIQLQAFGPKTVNPQLNRIHEIEGARIAGEILRIAKYEKHKTKQILEIIEGHDSRGQSLSLNDMLVKDADKLWRYSKSGVDIDNKRFGERFDQSLRRLRTNMNHWFFTDTARELAADMVLKRAEEYSISDY